MVVSLGASKANDPVQTEWGLFQRYIHDLEFDQKNQPSFEDFNQLESAISYRMEYYRFHRDQLENGVIPRSAIKRGLARHFYHVNGGSLFSETWYVSPKIDFHDDFAEEMINLTEIWKKDFYSDNPYLPEITEGFWGFREDEYTIIRRLPDSDIQLLEKAGFPYHKEGFAERFPWEVKIWERIVEEWKKGKWVVFLPY